MTKEIPLTQGKVALVDDRDYPEVSKFKWCTFTPGKIYYAVRGSPGVNGRKHLIYMHSIIIGTPKGMQTDHINGDGLDNRRENLRVVTCRENQQNLHIKKTSKYPGIYFDGMNRRWRVRIYVNKKRCSLGSFGNEEKAAQRYQIACDWQVIEL